MTNKIRILLVAANPVDSDHLALPKEFREIEEAIKRTKHGQLFEIHQTGATRYQDLRRQLLDYQPHILHFSGHGSTQGLLLEDDNGKLKVASNTRLSTLFKYSNRQLQCLIFNACDSQTLAKLSSPYSPYSIGMNAPITDQTAIDFAIGFYDAIGAACSYSDAFQLGINAIEDNSANLANARSFELKSAENPLPEIIPVLYQLYPKQSLSAVSTFKQKQDNKENKDKSLQRWAAYATIIATFIAVISFFFTPPSPKSTASIENPVVEELKTKGTVQNSKGELLAGVDIKIPDLGIQLKSNALGVFDFTLKKSVPRSVRVYASKANYKTWIGDIRLGDLYYRFILEQQ